MREVKPSASYLIVLVVLSLWLLSPKAAADDEKASGYAGEGSAAEDQAGQTLAKTGKGMSDSGQGGATGPNSFRGGEDIPLFDDLPGGVRGQEGGRSELGGVTGLWSIFVWTAILIGCVIGGVFLLKKLFPGTKSFFNSDLIKILGRTYLSPNHYLCLAKVGSRVVLFGVTKERLTLLTEITDEEEITLILSKVPAGRESVAHSFSSLLNRFIGGRDKVGREAPADSEDKISKVRIEVENLRKQMSHWK